MSEDFDMEEPTPCPECGDLAELQEMRHCRECRRLVCLDCWRYEPGELFGRCVRCEEAKR